MRKDIEIHINTGDIVINPINKVKLYPFSWTTNPLGLSRYIYGEIQMPGNIPESIIRNSGIYSVIPYTPKYSLFVFRCVQFFHFHCQNTEMCRVFNLTPHVLKEVFYDTGVLVHFQKRILMLFINRNGFVFTVFVEFGNCL